MTRADLTPTAPTPPPRRRRLLATIDRGIGRFSVSLRTLTVLIAISMALRVVLLAVYVDAGTMTPVELLHLFVAGFRFDLLVGLIFLLPQILHMSICPDARVRGRISRVAIHGGLLVTFGFALFLAPAEFLFFDEFSSRFNSIAFEYLIYPTEVVTNIRESYPVWTIFAIVSALSLGLWLPQRRHIDALLEVPLSGRRRFALAGAAVMTIGLLSLTTGIETQRVSANRVANEAAGSGLFSFFYYAWTNRFEYDAFYLTRPEDECFRILRTGLDIAEDDRGPEAADTIARVVRTGHPERRLNVVLIVEESLGSDFAGALGDDRGLTPCFDALVADGILFDNFFATGNRTARALEAALVSLPPIPTEAILKRDRSEHVFTLANVLEDRGYRRLFVYGGRGIFDGMRSFMLANGFERFIEQRDYPAPTFTSAWGVCDEDIFDRALAEFDALHEAGDPFLSVILSVSNHRPFTYPDGRIPLPSADQGREHAVRYADHALGRFFRMAKQRPFHDGTLYVVFGDHGARVYGAQMFPLESYRIPALIILPDGEHAGSRCSTLACTLDIAPTIMGLLGGDYRSTFFGRNVLGGSEDRGRALMQHNRNLALLQANDRMTILGCPTIATFLELDRTDFTLRPAAEPDTAALAEAIAYFQIADHLYDRRALLPPTSAATPRGGG